MSHWERLAAMLGLKSSESKETTPPADTPSSAARTEVASSTGRESSGKATAAESPLAELFTPTT
ncbi:MAG: hypothetical protein ACK6A8_19330, partial [Planctomycetota bacterium]